MIAHHPSRRPEGEVSVVVPRPRSSGECLRTGVDERAGADHDELGATEVLLAERAEHEITVRDITQQADASRVRIIRRFSSLSAAVFANCLEKGYACTGVALAHGGPPLFRLQRLGRPCA